MQDDRWEYRVWLEDAGTMSQRIAEAAKLERSAETRTDHYFLTGDDHLLAKIRGGKRFEIKELLEERSGCERWMLAVSTPFPVGAHSLDQLLGDARDMPSAKALIEAASHSIAIIDVKKYRRRFELGTTGAEAEVTTVSLSGDTYHTVGVEAPNFETCVGLVKALDMEDRDNTDYGSFLRGKLA